MKKMNIRCHEVLGLVKSYAKVVGLTNGIFETDFAERTDLTDSPSKELSLIYSSIKYIADVKGRSYFQFNTDGKKVDDIINQIKDNELLNDNGKINRKTVNILNTMAKTMSNYFNNQESDTIRCQRYAEGYKELAEQLNKMKTPVMTNATLNKILATLVLIGTLTIGTNKVVKDIEAEKALNRKLPFAKLPDENAESVQDEEVEIDFIVPETSLETEKETDLEVEIDLETQTESVTTTAVTVEPDVYDPVLDKKPLETECVEQGSGLLYQESEAE